MYQTRPEIASSGIQIVTPRQAFFNAASTPSRPRKTEQDRVENASENVARKGPDTAAMTRAVSRGVPMRRAHRQTKLGKLWS
jgi:hypothetical protein